MVKGHKDKNGNFHPHEPYRKKGISSSDFSESPDDENRKPPGGTNWYYSPKPPKDDKDEIKIEKQSDREKILSIARMGGLLTATALSAALGNPLPLAIYKIYVTERLAYNIIQKLEKENFKKKLEDLKQIGLNATMHQIYDKKSEEFSQQILYAICSSGLINQIVNRTSLNENLINNAFESTLKIALSSGIDNLSNLVGNTL